MQRTAYIMLGIVCFFCLLMGLGRVPLMGLDESLYSEVSREMAVSGNYIVPHYNGQPFYDKPPLVYWMQALCIKTFGANSFSVRLPSAIISILLVAFVVYLGRKLFSEKAGIYAGFILACCFLTTGLARMGIIDMAFTFTIALSLGTFILAYTERIPRWGYLLSWAALGLAVMTKGPAGAVLAGATILIFLAIRRDMRTMLKVYPLIGFVIMLAIALPWFLITNARTGGDFLQEFIFHQNLARAAGKDFAHNSPLYAYIPIILIGFLPWSIYLPTAFKYKSENNPGDGRWSFLVTWTAVIFIIFSIIVSKLPGYIYPVFPALALIVGAWWAREDVKGLKWSSISSAIVCTILSLAMIAAPNISDDLKTGALPITFVCMGAFLLLGTLGSLYFSIKGKKTHSFVCITTGTALFLCSIVYLGLPTYSWDTDGAAVPIAKYIKANVPGEPTVIAYDYDQKLANMPSLPFYLGRKVDFIWDPVKFQSILNSGKQTVVVTEIKKSSYIPENLHELARFGKYVIYFDTK